MTVPKVEINSPVINIQAPKITVNPVVNLHSQDLIQRSDGKIKVPEIVVNLSTSTSDFSAKWWFGEITCIDIFELLDKFGLFSSLHFTLTEFQSSYVSQKLWGINSYPIIYSWDQRICSAPSVKLSSLQILPHLGRCLLWSRKHCQLLLWSFGSKCKRVEWTFSFHLTNCGFAFFGAVIQEIN